jgi:hypothetical protein
MTTTKTRKAVPPPPQKRLVFPKITNLFCISINEYLWNVTVCVNGPTLLDGGRRNPVTVCPQRVVEREPWSGHIPYTKWPYILSSNPNDLSSAFIGSDYPPSTAVQTTFFWLAGYWSLADEYQRFGGRGGGHTLYNFTVTVSRLVVRFQRCPLRFKTEGGCKVKLSLCLANQTLRHEDVSGSRGLFDLGSTWRWVFSFTPRPLYPRGKSPRYPLDRGLGEPQKSSGRYGEEQILDSTGTRTQTPRSSSLQPVALPKGKGEEMKTVTPGY